jgi:hypothetical protein
VKSKVYIINGPARAGKDTFVELAEDLCFAYKSKYDIMSKSTIENLAYIAKDQFGYNPEVKSDKDRKFLSDFKRLVDDYCDYTFKTVTSTIDIDIKNRDRFVLASPVVYFVHVREPYNIYRFTKHFYKSKTIFVDTTRNIHSVTNNESDLNVRDYDYDITVHNDGSIDDYREVVKRFLISEGIIEVNKK